MTICEKARSISQECFPEVEPIELFTLRYFILNKINDAWISPSGDIYPLVNWSHGIFECALQAIDPNFSTAEKGWMKISGRDFDFDFYAKGLWDPKFLTGSQKSILLILSEIPYYTELDTGFTPNDLLNRNEQLSGSL